MEKQNSARINRGRHLRSLKVGDSVLVKNSVASGSCHKFLLPWSGPCKIIEKSGPVTYLVERAPGQVEYMHIDRLKHYPEPVEEIGARKGAAAKEEELLDGESDSTDSEDYLYRRTERNRQRVTDKGRRRVQEEQVGLPRRSSRPRHPPARYTPDPDSEDSTSDSDSEHQTWSDPDIESGTTYRSDDEEETEQEELEYQEEADAEEDLEGVEEQELAEGGEGEADEGRKDDARIQEGGQEEPRAEEEPQEEAHADTNPAHVVPKSVETQGRSRPVRERKPPRRYSP